MKYFTANIDENNFNLLNVASETSGIKYEKGVRMTSDRNNDEIYVFHPIFCKSIDDAVSLVKEYSNIKAKKKNIGHDLILHEVLIKILMS